ncbi:hypothetical protein KX928_19645 [Roseobacter sp. YSTF-M11]|uniref:Uncharacterized protein n=1 Tax=Roseobacter insulae TaxID=2859783 RepID=A0A9X1FYC4_9RHOB|nr:hypothetical protein [Roseobacter insulae]MBW4710004.1 hypothetical protein [Roseobacter insulae]
MARFYNSNRHAAAQMAQHAGQKYPTPGPRQMPREAREFLEEFGVWPTSG